MMRKILAWWFLLVAPLLAQNRINGPPLGAVGPSLEASAGFVYLSMAMPSQRVALLGGDAKALVKVSTRWGATVDGTCAHTGYVLGTEYNGNFLSCLTSPVFYPVVHRNFGVFVRAMVGANWVDSAVPVSGTKIWEAGWLASRTQPGRFEHSLFGPFSVQIAGDYQRTTFVNPNEALNVQNNLRLSASFAYRFGNRWGLNLRGRLASL